MSELGKENQNSNPTWPTDCKHNIGRVKSISHNISFEKIYTQNIVAVCSECNNQIKLNNLKYYASKKPGDEISILHALRLLRRLREDESSIDC